MPRQTFTSYAEQLTRLFFNVATILTLSFSLISTACANNWQKLAAGIEYKDLGSSLLSPWSHIHVFRIDLKANQLDLVTARDLSKNLASVTEFGFHSHALLSINGGFFDQKYQPLGLRIGHGKQHNPLKQISWWGIFYIKNQKAHISNHYHYTSDKQIDFAIQSGPRLIVDGKLLTLREGFAERSALGITQDGHVIILVTENAPITTTMLAKLMQSPAIDCTNALNLDGGGSSQLYAHMDSFKMNVHGFSNVSDAIIVKPKN